MLVSAGRLTEEMSNSYRYLREGFSGKYLALYVIMENGVFFIIMNYTLYSIYSIIKTIKISKLRLTGHIMRMPEENPVKKLTLQRPEGSRRAGRPKLRWLDGVEEDLRTFGIRGWRRRALDRDRWKEVLTVARVQNSTSMSIIKINFKCSIQLKIFI